MKAWIERAGGQQSKEAASHFDHEVVLANSVDRIVVPCGRLGGHGFFRISTSLGSTKSSNAGFDYIHQKDMISWSCVQFEEDDQLQRLK